MGPTSSTAALVQTVHASADPLAGAPPLLLPLSVVAFAVAVLASGRFAAWLGTSRLVGAVMLLDVGLLLAATLGPVICEDPVALAALGTCDLSRLGISSAGEMLGSTDIAANVMALVPLGFALAFVPRSRRKAAVLAGAVALPFVIEAVQLLVVPLGRACQGRDIVDNLTGLAVGLVTGMVVAGLLSVLRLRPARRSI